MSKLKELLEKNEAKRKLIDESRTDKICIGAKRGCECSFCFHKKLDIFFKDMDNFIDEETE